MKISLAKAYNGVHKQFAKHLKNLGHEVRYFDIDGAGYPAQAEQADGDVYLWNADDKYENRHLILDRVFFLENYLGRPVFPDLNMYYPFNDKIKQYQILKFLQIPQIPTFITFDQAKALQRAENIDYPVILKDAHSCEGKGVFKIDSSKELTEMIEQIFSPAGFHRPELFCRIKDYVYLQDFIPDLGRDLRVVVIGDRVAAAYWRIAPDGEWKTNVSSGGTVSFEDIPQKALDTCLNISKKMNYHWMAYDLVIRGNKPYVTEFSPVFGVKGAKEGGLDIRK